MNLGSIPKVREQANAIAAEIERVRKSGDVLQGMRLEKTAAGGTASKAAKGVVKYARLRVGKGGSLANGKKSEYVPLGSIGEIEAAIARGKKINKLERKLARVREELAALEKLAWELGLNP